MSSAIPATTAKLPIIRNIGTTATCSLVRNCALSLASTESAGSAPIISPAHSTPSRPSAAASGTAAASKTHTPRTTAIEVQPGAALANDDSAGKAKCSTASASAVATSSAMPVPQRSTSVKTTSACTSVVAARKALTTQRNGAIGTLRYTVVALRAPSSAAYWPTPNASTG